MAAAKGARDMSDPRSYRDRTVFDAASAAFDDDLVGIGATPFNDPTSQRIMVPQAATLNGPRYLLRTAAAVVEAGNEVRLRGIRQAIGIGTVLRDNVSDPQNPKAYVVEIDQTSPFWHFSDGNISWHLRVIYGPAGRPGFIRAASPGDIVQYTSGTDTGRMVSTNPAQVSPGRGRPPGKPLGTLGTFRDLRWPWSSHGAMDDLDVIVRGPGIIALYASIRQTDPATRQKLGPLLPLTFDPSVLLPEDRFLLQVPDAYYRHVSGSLIIETGGAPVGGYNFLMADMPLTPEI
jgi:hypothetical protein